MSILHNGIEHQDTHRDVCSSCVSEKSLKPWGCETHSGSARFVRPGNPLKSERYKNAKEAIMMAREDWEEKGAMWLLPSELREIRTVLLSADTLMEDLELWVFVLLSVKLFLRFDEGDNMHTSHFKESLHAVSASDISALALRIKGKCDTHWNWICFWRDYTDPELCPIRHLLIYIFVSGICQGPLFPGHKELNSCANGSLLNGECQTKLGYDTVRLGLQHAAKNVLKVRTSALEKKLSSGIWPLQAIGSHSGLKTASLLGIFGGGVLAALMQAARHVTAENALKYVGAGLAMENVYDNQPIGTCSENRVNIADTRR
jgi:hypothetical protein